MLLIAVLSAPFIQLIYERGEFNSHDTFVVSNMLSIYALSIPFNILSKILFTCFYAKKDTNTPLKISIFSLFLNIILNICLFKIIGQYCVITATTISAILSTIVSIIVLKKRNILLLSLKDLYLSYRIAILSIITCLIVPMFLFFYLQYNIFLTLFIAGTLHLFGCFLLRLIRPVLNCLLDR
jgi:putative peptidoglycan lipid II flippase